jgi:hypothetical protein
MNEPEKPKKGWGCLQLIVVIVTLFFSGLYWLFLMSGMANMGDLRDGTKPVARCVAASPGGGKGTGGVGVGAAGLV